MEQENEYSGFGFIEWFFISGLCAILVIFVASFCLSDNPDGSIVGGAQTQIGVALRFLRALVFLPVLRGCISFSLVCGSMALSSWFLSLTWANVKTYKWRSNRERQ